MNDVKKKTILLVEDEAVLAMTEKLSLEKYGYAVVVAYSGEDAVETVRSTVDIDLILMDINLGNGMDGTQAAEIILKNYNLPVVFLSSHTEPEIVEKTEKITSYGYVVKSSNITILDASIKMAFKLFEAKNNEKKKEDSLLEAKQFNEQIIQSVNEGIIVYDKDLRYLLWNPFMENITGIPAGEIIGKHPLEVFPFLN